MRLHPRAVRLLLSLLALLGAMRPVRALAAAPCPQPAPPVVKDLRPGATTSAPGQLVNVNGTLYFAASEVANEVELWKFEAAAAEPVVLVTFPSGVPRTELHGFTAVGSRLFFTVYHEPDITELWKSDGTAGTTERLATFGNQSLLGSEFVAVGDLLFFRASTSSSGAELWRSDGTPAGTRLVQEIGSGSTGSNPSKLTAMNGELFFVADDGATGAELWKSNGAGTSVAQVADLRPLMFGSDPDFLRAMGGSLYFAANDGSASGIGLWKSSGAVGDVQLVANALFMPGHVGPLELTVAGDTLFFWLDDTVHGYELWASDGTPQRTRLVKDINPGGDSNPSLLTAVEGTLFFLASDGTTGQELWRSDGTEAGTFLVRDIASGSNSLGGVDSMVAGPGQVLAVLNDLSSGYELWKSDGLGATRLTDITPLGATALPRSLTMAGTRLFFTAEAPNMGRELFVMPLGELDCTDPIITCPTSVTLEATSPQGAFFSVPPPIASDDALAQPVVSVTGGATHGTFGLGTTALNFTATDAAGNQESCLFNVTVQDTTPPRLLCPQGEVVLEATMPTGAAANYFVGASDAVVPAPTMTYSLQPGRTVAIGTSQTVTVSADDGRTPKSTCSFTLTVRDTVAPKLTCPKDFVQVATSPEPITVTYDYDLDEAAPATPEVTTDFPSGSEFPVGVTPVTLTARDTSGHESQCTFFVANVDPTSPEITCPGPQEVVATSAAGAVVSFPEAMARDNVGSPTVSYSPAQGSTFPLGQTTVTATAEDLAKNQASCTFTVTVVEGSDEVPPPPQEGCGCGAGSWSGGLGWLVLALAPLLSRRRAGRVAR